MKSLILLLLLVCQVAVAAAPAVQERTFHSQALGRDMHYLVILPVGYDTSQRRYPVLYLLHGWHGDYRDWVHRTNLVQLSRRYPLIIVTPDGQNSWYVNSATIPPDRFFDYLTDVVGDVDSHWRSVESPHRRAMAGLSMGGYGSVLLALKHPDMVAMVGSLSGAFEGPVGIEKVMPVLQDSLAQAYGPPDSPTRSEYDVYSLARPGRLPYLYLECGSEDPLLPANRRFVDVLSSQHIPYEYHESAGGHAWDYWDRCLPRLLDAVARRIAS